MSRETTVSTEGIVCSGISPRLTEWLPELLTELWSHTERTVRYHVPVEDPWQASVQILSTTLSGWATLDRQSSDDPAEAVAYTHAITALTRTYRNTAVDGTTYPAIRRVIDEIAMTHDVPWTPHEPLSLVRLCLRLFGPSDTHRWACPYDVVVSLLRALSESQYPTPADIERALATLPTTRFRPDLTPTATKLYATLLQAKQPLGRSELIDRAAISASSYDRRLATVRALKRVRAAQVEGHRRWTIDDATSSITSVSWWPTHVGATSPSTPLLASRYTNDTGDGVVSTTIWSPGRQSVHIPVSALTPRSTATVSYWIRDTSFPVNVLPCLRLQYMLQNQIHQNLRFRVPDRQHRDAQFAN